MVTSRPCALPRFNDEVKHIKVVEKDSWVHITEAKKFESLLVGDPVAPSASLQGSWEGPGAPRCRGLLTPPPVVGCAFLPAGKVREVGLESTLGQLGHSPSVEAPAPKGPGGLRAQ